MAAAASESPFVIFLGIDGVLFNNSGEHDVIGKAKELFPKADFYGSPDLDAAATHFFDKTAVTNLDTIIKEIEKTRTVWMVITSNWKVDKNVEELRKIFSLHNFSNYIVDKTLETDKNLEERRAIEIHLWLLQHAGIKDFAILDIVDDHLSENYGNKFFKIDARALLTKETADAILRNFNSDFL